MKLRFLRGSGSKFPGPSRDILGLMAFFVLCLAVSGVGGAITATSVGSWYAALHKPPFNPPDWLFAPVWTTLYIFMAIAGWRVWRYVGFWTNRKALTVFAVQLALNLAWSFIFFGLRHTGLALLEIVILLSAIIVNTVMFWRIDRWAGALFVPYAIWVAFATLLNASLWWLN